MTYRRLLARAALVVAMGAAALATSKPLAAAQFDGCLSYCDTFCGACEFRCSRSCMWGDCEGRDGEHYPNPRSCTALF